MVGQDLVEEMNKLQEVLGLIRSDLSLPQIAVVGTQSSGKSSVLENIVGKDFLPRGSGIVTRCPLILQLMPTNNTNNNNNNSSSTSSTTSSSSSSSNNNNTWAEFAHTGTVKFTDFDMVRKEIARETDRMAPGQSVTATPIILRVFSPQALPLTLIDLPGLTRIPVGNQPKDIEQKLRELILHHIQGENTIILAVQAATQDLATSDALQLASTVDPQHQRTIGVLTKVDIMDRGTDVSKILDGGVFPLKLGYVPVVNRSQKDIETNIPIEFALKREFAFFNEHPVYRNYASRCGSHYLAQKCNELLTEHIQKSLPNITKQVTKSLTDAKQELMDCGQPLSNDPSELGWMLLQIINNFASLYEATINGHTSNVIGELNTHKLNAGARLRVLFHEKFYDALHSIDPTDGLTLDEYRTAIRNAAGPRPSLFIPDPAFQLLMKKQLERLRAPCLNLVQMCYNEMISIISQLETPELKRFPALRGEIIAITNNVLTDILPQTNTFISELINIELAYINTNHPEFAVSAHRQVSAEKVPPPSSGRLQDSQPTQHQESRNPFARLFFGPPKTDNASSQFNSPPPTTESDLDVMGAKPSEREMVQIRLIKQLLRDYFAIVSRSMQDSVIKAVWHFLIDGSKKHLHHALVSKLYKPEKSSVLLRENHHIAQKREMLAEKVKAYQNAAQILQTYEQRRRYF